MTATTLRGAYKAGKAAGAAHARAENEAGHSLAHKPAPLAGRAANRWAEGFRLGWAVTRK